jgi:hypothetical protein
MPWFSCHIFGVLHIDDVDDFSLDGHGVRTSKPIEVEMPELLKGETCCGAISR